MLLDYRLDESYESYQRHVNLATADEWVLGSDCFLGEVDFTVDGQDLRVGPALVPVLAVARGLYLAVAQGHSYAEDFEVGRLVEFAFQNDDVVLRSRFTGGSAEARRTVLHVALREFCARVVRELGERHPALLGNNIVTTLLDRIRRDDTAAPELVRVLPKDPDGIGDQVAALLWSGGGLVDTSLARVDVELMPAPEPILDEQPDLSDFSRPLFLAGGPAAAAPGLVRRAVRLALTLHGLAGHPAARLLG
ncbi:hypothetical protein M8C13_16455 [Crossiella sp. SN42]|uniref:hypothetical protein n=1 Tax=Crossiella sp. SN42 TaxID=2944808 RepID=UPI00207CD1D6|nr:hypothetical protein [Crossiella sp. SN42]MCO1577350.1 hypothetical protein [Crossiella sp. SN42]